MNGESKKLDKKCEVLNLPGNQSKFSGLYNMYVIYESYYAKAETE